MGLKTVNYEVKSLGITLPNAYALLKDIKINDATGIATFVVQSTREMALKMKPIETVKIEFAFDRTKNPVETAYITAKGKRIETVADEQTWQATTKEVNQPFYGWEDDIL